jgi:hypothetical protein
MERKQSHSGNGKKILQFIEFFSFEPSDTALAEILDAWVDSSANKNYLTH